MSAQLSIEGDEISGEIALAIPPGMVAKDQNRAIDEALAVALDEVAGKLGAVLAAPPHKFVRPVPGKDAEGKLRFAVRARSEGGLLVPDHNAPKRRRR